MQMWTRVALNTTTTTMALCPTANPLGADAAAGPGGGIQWTIKDGIPYEAPRLLREVRQRRF
jgi:hypothetical protein